MEQELKLSQSLEDYLEAILVLEKRHRVARVKDIAEYLDVQMPSVTGALKNLSQKKLIEYQKNSYIYLTQEGLARANRIKTKHRMIQQFLTDSLLLNKETAEEIACKMEHVIPEKVVAKIDMLREFIEQTVKNDDALDQHYRKKIEEGDPKE